MAKLNAKDSKIAAAKTLEQKAVRPHYRARDKRKRINVHHELGFGIDFTYGPLRDVAVFPAKAAAIIHENEFLRDLPKSLQHRIIGAFSPKDDLYTTSARTYLTHVLMVFQNAMDMTHAQAVQAFKLGKFDGMYRQYAQAYALYMQEVQGAPLGTPKMLSVRQNLGALSKEHFVATARAHWHRANNVSIVIVD